MEQGRVLKGTRGAGQFAAAAHAEPGADLLAHANRFAGLENVRELDAAASEAIKPLLVPDATDQEMTSAGQIRDEWMDRRHEIFTAAWRRNADSYAERLETEAQELLRKAAEANLRNIADRLREKHPDAATMTLQQDYDDGNLAIYVEAVHDKDGNELAATDTAQELVSEYSSRQLSRFVDDGPIDLPAAAAWMPDHRAPNLH